MIQYFGKMSLSMATELTKQQINTHFIKMWIRFLMNLPPSTKDLEKTKARQNIVGKK